MKEQKEAKEKKAVDIEKDQKLDPCTTPNSAEASRPLKDEDACDEGVR